MVVGGGWVVCTPILVFSFSLGQAELIPMFQQIKFLKRIECDLNIKHPPLKRNNLIDLSEITLPRKTL